VTLVDNKKYPAEEFLRSAKTILGLQREIKFNQLLAYFKEHDSPFDELTLVELDKYGLKEISEKQQHIVDYSMAIMDRMEKEGKTVQSVYGNILINENNELSVGSSAAYVKYDGIVNITPGKSFAITLRDKIFNEEALKARLGDRFQGKIIRGSMWIYNEPTPLLLSKEELIEVIR
jgi:hypothetical protein